MKKLSVIAIVAAGLTLAGGGRWAAAMSQFDWGSAASMGFEDANGNASLPAYSQIIVAALHPGVTESQVQSDFAVGNVSKILTQDFDVYNWAPLGWSGGCGPTGLNYQGGAVDLDTMAPAGLVNVEADVSVQNTTMMSYFASKEVYYLAINGTCSYPVAPPTANGLPVYVVPSGITEMGIWGTQSGTGSGDSGTDVFPPYSTAYGSDLSDQGYYAVVGQYNVPAGPAFQAVVTTLMQQWEPGWNGVWPVAELAYLPLPGDANHDGKVDVNDLTIVLTNFGKSSGMSWSTGDFNGDGKVDVNDLTIVLAHYGQSIGASAAATAAVPEPSCLVLVGIAVAGLLACASPRWG